MAFELERGGGLVTFKLVDLQEHLRNRPVTTETIEGTGAEIMSYILGTFGGLNNTGRTLYLGESAYTGDNNALAVGADYDVDADNGEIFSKTNISDNSITESINKLAQACNVEVYVDYKGTLRTALKKTDLDPVDFVIDAQDIISKIDTESTDILLPSIVRVRGRNVASIETGLSYLIQNASYTSEAIADDITVIYVTLSTATETQMKEAVVTELIGATEGRIISFEDSVAEVQFRGGGWSVGQQATVSFSIVVPPPRDREIAASVNDTLSIGTGRSMDNVKKAQDLGVLNYHRGNTDNQLVRNSNESTISRVETVTADPISLPLVGSRYIEIDNPYIQDEISAEEIGVRFLLEKRMARNSYSWSHLLTDNTFYPLNSVVTLPLADFNITKKLLIVNTKFKFEATTMSVTVEYTGVEILPN